MEMRKFFYFFTLLTIFFLQSTVVINSFDTSWHSAHATFYGEGDASGTIGDACGYGKWVPCVRKGGLRFTINGYSYFNLVLIWNAGGAGSIKAVWVKGWRTAWQVVQPNMRANWLVVSYLDGQSLSFLVTNTDSQTMLFQDIMVSTYVVF